MSKDFDASEGINPAQLTQLIGDNAISVEVDPLVLVAQQGEHSVLLDFERGEYFGLNDTASRVWELLRQAQPVSAIIDTVVREYDVTADVACTDLAVLLSNLAHRRLIRLTGC